MKSDLSEKGENVIIRISETTEAIIINLPCMHEQLVITCSSDELLMHAK